MKALIIILLVFLFFLILYFFSSYTALFPKVVMNDTNFFYILGKIKIEKGKIYNFNASFD
jgi:hypothetical protein